MAIHLGQHLARLTDQLRFEPVTRRIRASHAGHPVLDSTGAALVWEPRRVVPMYAVPPADLLADLTPCPPPPMPAAADLPPVLGPAHFGWHLADGRSYAVHVAGRSFEAAAFAPADPDLGGRLILAWQPFDWVEEAQPVSGHPHDTFHRIDVLRSERHVVVSLGGQVLADSHRPLALYETGLPVRWYLPRDDVRTDLLTPSPTTSVCAYKGEAGYLSFSAAADAGTDVAWTYPQPVHEAAPIKDHVCFYAERTDLQVDGVAAPRPRTMWSPPDPAGGGPAGPGRALGRGADA